MPPISGGAVPPVGASTRLSAHRSHRSRTAPGGHSLSSDQRIESYPYNEFIYVISGSITLVGADGSVLEAKVGESLAIPQGWKGQWKTTGYRKYYALYTIP